ncbi:MAG: IS4 family transposase [Chitinophagaceae bacterium]|nr:IS4 family transposase [Chitinophagaceae bacterium]
MTVNEILKLIPEQTFRDLAVETKVDSQVKKLSGELMFKLILFSMLRSNKLSLRVMETYLQSANFKSFTGYDVLDGKYNSLRDRICTINCDYFEQLFNTIFGIYNKCLKEEKALSKADSTYVALASKLFSIGMENGTSDKKFVKYSVNIKGSLPSKVKVHTAQSHVSEDLALRELIDEDDQHKENIVVFDRGLQSRHYFEKFTVEKKLFVGRTKPNVRCREKSNNILPPKPNNSTVTLTSDTTGNLINQDEKPTQAQYRVIKGTIDSNGDAICFITNILDEDPYQIAAWYKQRWEIEVFFKFIKQHLNAKHLVSRSPNGIKVMLYMTMILATLIIVYKKLNKIGSYKIARLKFELELDNDAIRNIVTMCGGDPNKAPHLFNST